MSQLAQQPAVILVVDSDPLMLTGVAAALHMQGHECHCAQDGAAALQAARALELDMVICDVKLRQESGIDLVRQIKELAPDLSVLFVSSQQQPDIIRRVHDSAGAYFLRKPFEPSVLIELVDTALWMPHLVRSQIGDHHEARAVEEPTAVESRSPVRTRLKRKVTAE